MCPHKASGLWVLGRVCGSGFRFLDFGSMMRWCWVSRLRLCVCGFPDDAFSFWPCDNRMLHLELIHEAAVLGCRELLGKPKKMP